MAVLLIALVVWWLAGSKWAICLLLPALGAESIWWIGLIAAVRARRKGGN